MATAADYLQTAYEQACQRLSELDTVAVTSRARMTYTVSGVSMDWNAYRAALVQQIAELGGSDGKAGLIQKALGPFEVYG